MKMDNRVFLLLCVTCGLCSFIPGLCYWVCRLRLDLLAHRQAIAILLAHNPAALEAHRQHLVNIGKYEPDAAQFK